jgi:hypothetical protein
MQIFVHNASFADKQILITMGLMPDDLLDMRLY